MKFKNGVIDIVNYGEQLTDDEVDTLINNYQVRDVNETNFKCKGWETSKKPVYLQCVDWIKLIPTYVLNNDSLVLKFPEHMPPEVAVYMVMEIYSRRPESFKKHPKVLEYRNGKMNRIVDLEYELNFSKMKRENEDQFNN